GLGALQPRGAARQGNGPYPDRVPPRSAVHRVRRRRAAHDVSGRSRRLLSQLIEDSLRRTLDRLRRVAALPQLDGEERQALEHLQLLMFVAVPARDVAKGGEAFLSFLRAE